MLREGVNPGNEGRVMCLGESFEGQSDMHISVRLEIYFWQIWLTYFLKIFEKISAEEINTIKSKISAEEEKFSATFSVVWRFSHIRLN